MCGKASDGSSSRGVLLGGCVVVVVVGCCRVEAVTSEVGSRRQAVSALASSALAQPPCSSGFDVHCLCSAVNLYFDLC